MSPIKSLLRLTEAMIPCLPVFIMGLFRLHESRLSVIADIGNEAWGRSTGYNTCPGQPRFPYYHPPLLLDYGTNNQQPTRPFEQNPKPRIQCIAQQDNPAVKKKYQRAGFASQETAVIIPRHTRPIVQQERL